MAAENPLASILGAAVVDTKGGQHPTADLAANDAVLLYFSAHWCPPCRGFTPELIKTYKNLKAAGKKVECVFVSSDRDQHAFDEYFGSMPWLGVPFADRQRKNQLSAKYKVQGIPTLVVLDGKTGATINKDGRGAVSSDPEGADFPWRPPTLADALGKTLVDPEGKEHHAAELAGKTLGIYFSAHWCGPCRQFTPQLIKTYNKLKTEGKALEIVFVSSDRDQAAFDEYHHSMPWLAVPFSDKKRVAKLSHMFNVEGIPTLVFVDYNSGKTINAEGREAVGSDPEGKQFPWSPKPVNELAGPTAVQLNEKAGLIVYLPAGADKAQEQKVVDALTPSATESFAKGEDADLLFFFAKQDRMVQQVAGAMGKKDQVLGIIDIPEGGVFWADVKDVNGVTAAAVSDFVAKYRAGGLEPRPLGGR